MNIPLHEIIHLIFFSGRYVCIHLDEHPTVNRILAATPNDILLREYDVIHTSDNILRSRACAVNDLLHLRHTGMKIEEILGYSSEEIMAWEDSKLIEVCMEHFVYTRPETKVPEKVKEKKKIVDDSGIEVIKPKKKKENINDIALQLLAQFQQASK